MPEWTIPAPGFLEVRVDGTRVTRFSVKDGEVVELQLDVDAPKKNPEPETEAE
jgi:hypothetical protein